MPQGRNNHMNHFNPLDVGFPERSSRSLEPVTHIEAFGPDGSIIMLEIPIAETRMAFEPRSIVPTNFEKITLHKGGDDKNCMVITFMGDGFTASQQGAFIDEVRRTTEYMLSEPPLSLHKNGVNIYAVKVISNVSGVATHPSNLIDNYFGSSSGGTSIPSYIWIYREQRAHATFDYYSPDCDVKAVIANAPQHSGFGGAFSVTAMHSAARFVVAHEMGHVFADLADEYWSGATGEAANRTADKNPATIRWRNFLGKNGIGIYPYGPTGVQSAWFRPHQNCKMQQSGAPFCDVCLEEFRWRIERIKNPLPLPSAFNGQRVRIGSAIGGSVFLEPGSPSTQIWSRREQNSQLWDVAFDAASNTYTLKNASNNNFLAQSGSNIILSNQINNNSRWKLNIASKLNNFDIVNLATNQALDVTGGNSGSGTQVIPYGQHGGNNQRWYFESTSQVPPPPPPPPPPPEPPITSSPLSPPQNARITNPTASTLTVAWDAPANPSGISSYEIFRSGSRISETTSLSFTDSNLSPNTSYSYQIRSLGTSSLSNSVTGTTQQNVTPPPPPPPPQGNLPEWSATKAYTAGTRVAYQGSEYVANYYTYGERPGSSTAWRLIGSL